MLGPIETAVAGSTPRHAAAHEKSFKNRERFAPKPRLWGVRTPRLTNPAAFLNAKAAKNAKTAKKGQRP